MFYLSFHIYNHAILLIIIHESTVYHVFIKE